ncbi:endonuclease/exonuclease/phosphatase family protein [Uruburuella testudinis]|uniref:Endonuclease/exonuclease/phosphatase family protein n=1 Tax=Uruburuella testudinis TaxID=1282863 RepID=A0ABY4DQI4_9NEIS|nr:endonuclease/exonuclease/phosphatase family protein [Uruburuella testudinis]UOO81317.1 endonuclease/exonuclease/phosphatase family protein [Uruburuella testudinis]
MPDLTTSDWLLLALLALPIVATLLPLVNHDHWLFRVFDFPRLQIAAVSLLCVVLNYCFQQNEYWLFTLFEVLNFACFAYQLKEIAAYTRLSRPEVLQYRGEDNGNTISLLTSNVLTPNRRADLLLAQVRRLAPDVVLTLESDGWWEAQLAPLEHELAYRYTVKIPLDNLYGMHLYSRLPLRNAQVRHWVAEDIPSINAELQLRSGAWIRIYCLHPMPPSPTEADTATDRDAELLLVGREIEHHDHSVLVFGDLNDVAWSRTSRLFQKISGLLDPRKGRGLYNTFHAKYPFLRWPLDHIFHSNDFMMTDIKVLPSIGSDHFPIYGKFQFSPAAEALQEETEADADDQQEAEEKIAEAAPLKEVVRQKYRH